MANKTIPAIQTNEGNVGIGTTTPIASLDVDNTIVSLPVLNLGGGEAGNNVSDLYILNSYNNNTGVGYAAKVIGVNISGSLTNQNIPIQRTTWGGVTSATAIALGTDGPRAGTQDNAFQIWTTNDASAGTALTQKFSVTSAGDVGIGTFAPSQKLDVNGAIIAGINNSYGAYTRSPGGVLKPWFATSGPHTFFYNTNLSGSIFWQNAADTASLMALSEQGRLGINTNDPSGRLHVLDTVLYPPSLTWNAVAAAIIRSENGQIAFGSDDTAPYGIWQQVRTASSTARPLLLNPSGGNIGIGVRNPTKKLHVGGSFYLDFGGPQEEHVVGISRTVASAAGSYTEIGILANSGYSNRATFEIFHHDCGTIEYSLFELMFTYYTGTTTDWVQLPSRTVLSYSGAPNGVVVDARLTANGNSAELRLRSIGGACGNMIVYVRIKSSSNLTESSGTGTGATVAGILGFNRYEFPISDNRFKATADGLFIKNNGFIGIGSTDPQYRLSISGTNSAIALSFGNTVPNNPLILSTYSGWAGIGMDSATAGLRLVGDYSSATAPLVDIGYYAAGAVGHGNWVSRLKTFNNGKLSVGGMASPDTLLSVGGLGSTTAASGLTFGQDPQANLYRVAEDSLQTDGNLYIAGLAYTNNSAYYSSVTKTKASNWGQYSTILGNNSYSSQIVQVLVNGGNLSWAGTFLVSANISYRPNETWGSVKLLEYANYNCGVDDVSLLMASNFSTGGFGSTALVLKTNGTVNGGLGTGLANIITVTVNSPSPSSVDISNSWTNPYTYQIATSANTKQIYVNESGNVGIGTAFPTNQANYKFLQVNGTNSAVIETMVGGTRIGGFDSTASALYVGTIGNFPVIFRTQVDEKMRITAGGNVGIGSTNPSSKLTIVQNSSSNALLLNSDSSSIYSTLEFAITGIQRGQLFADSSDDSLYIRTNLSGPLKFGTSNSQRMTIDSAGNVGIGLSAPAGLLHVYSTASRYINFTPSSVSGLLVQRNQLVSSQGTTVLTLTNTQGPEAATDRGTSLNLDIGYGGSASAAGSIARGARIAALNSSVYDATAANQNAYLAFYTATAGSLTEKVRIQSNGNVGIGTTAPSSVLHLSATGATELRITSTTSNTNSLLSFYEVGLSSWGIDAGQANGTFFIKDLYNARSVLTLTSLGRVGICTTSPTTLLSIGGAGSTTAASGITLGGDASANLYRDSSASIRTDGGFLAASRIRSLDYIQFNTNLYANAFTNYIDINVGNVAANAWISAIRINPGGYVGIGTTVPSGKLHVNSTVVGETVLRADGTNGTLFSVVDDLSDSLMSVNNSAGLPVLEVFADDRVVMGQYGSGDLVVRNNKVGIGTTNPINKLSVIGNASIGSTYNVAAPANGLIVQGNVGIGTTVPNCKLNIYGEVQIASSSAYTTHFNYNDVGTNFITTANGGTTYFRGSTNNLTSMTVDGGGTVTTQYNTYLATVNGNVGIGTTSATYKLDVSGTIRADRYRGINSLTLNTYATANPASNVFLYSQGNDRDSWLYLDSADTASNWGIYHRQIDSTVSNLPGNSIGFIGGGSSSLQAYISLANGSAYFAGNVGVGITNPASLLAVGPAGATTAANGLTFGGDAQANIYRYAEDTLATDGNFNAAGNVNSKNSRTAVYTSVTSGTNGTWYPLFNILDSTDATVYCNLRTYAHSSVSFIVARGYNLSNTHNITILNCQINANGGYANVTGVRIKQDGGVEIQLSWSSGPIVNIGVQIIGTDYTPSLVGALTPTANGTAVIDSVVLTNGMIRTLRDIITEGGSVGIGIANPTNKLHVIVPTPTGSRIQLGSTSTSSLMNAGLVNDFLILTAPFNAVPASTSNNNAKWGIKMGGGSTDAPNALEKSACIYAVSEEDIGGGGAGAGYNRRVGLALHTSPFDLPNVERVRITNLGNVGIATTSPIHRLQVGNFTSTSTASTEKISLGGTYSDAPGSNVKLRVYDDNTSIGGMSVSSGQMEINTWSAGKIAFYRATTQMAIFNANGNLGIGNVLPNGARVHIKTDNTNPSLRIEDPLIEGPAGGTAGRALRGWLPIMTGVNATDKVYIPLYGPLA